MAAFIGKWKGDGSSYTNYDAFCKAAGVPEDMVEKFRDDVTEIEMKLDGDTWTSTINSTLAPEKSYTYKSGVELEGVDLLGSKFKYTSTVISDTKLEEVESSEMMEWKPMKITREIIDNDTMLTTCELECGTKMTQTMKRIK